MTGPEKELFKFWVEKIQLEKFKQLSERRKLSVSWLMRQAFDEYLQREDAQKHRKAPK
jgi:predicted transcriptional regulator